MNTPSPLILMQPGPEGLGYVVYGMEHAEVIEAARLLIVHMAAQHAGMTVLSGTISRGDVVAVVPAAVASAAPSVNGNGPQTMPLRKKPGPAKGTPKPKPKPKRLALEDFEALEIVRTGGYDVEDEEEY